MTTLDFNLVAHNICSTVSNIGGVLWQQGYSTAVALATTLIAIRIIFAGFTIMFGQGTRTFSDQFFDIVIKVVMIYFLVYHPVIQNLLTSAIWGMLQGGHQAADGILGYAATNTSAIGQEPPTYWATYIIGPTASGGAVDPTQCMFSFQWVLKNIFGWNNIGGTGVGADVWFYRFTDVMCLAYAFIMTLSFAPTVFGTGIGMAGPLLVAQLIAPFAIGGLVTVLMIGGSAIVTIIGLTLFAGFSFLGSMIGPLLVFYMVKGLGVAVMPLIFFRQFEGVWIEYLIFLTSAVLAIYLYYICSAIGFVISTNLIGDLFSGPASGQSPMAAFLSNYTGNLTVLMPGVADFLGALLPTGITQLFLKADPNSYVSMMLSGVAGVTAAGAGVPSIPTGIAPVLMAALCAPAAWAAGIGVLATIITGGISMSGMAVGFAFAWNKAFTSADAIGTVREVFQKIGTSIHSGASSVVNTGMQKFSGGVANIGGSLGSLGR